MASASEVRAAVESAFRDYETDGVPASGDHLPVKSDIRFALGQLLESTLSSIGSALIPYATVALRNADTSGPAGKLGYVYRNNGSPTDPANGVYQWTGSAWESATWYYAAVAAVVQPLVDSATASADAAAASAATLTPLLGVFDLTDTLVPDALFGVRSNDGSLPFVVNKDGSAEAAQLKSQDVNAQQVRTSKMALQDGFEQSAGSFEFVADVPGLAFAIATADGNLPFAWNDDGSLDMNFDRAARYSGGAWVDPAAVIVARRYALDRRHVFIYWRTGTYGGKTIQLTTDNTADHSVTGFDSASGFVGIQKRTVDRIEQYVVDARTSGNSLLPVHSTRDIFLLGDSFVQSTLLTALKTAAVDKNRNWQMSGSGGSWLTAHLAALGGSRVPAGTGADGGVVPASQVGSNPTRSGGQSQTEVVGTISNGSGGSGNILNVTSVTRGAIAPGQQLIIPGGGLLAGTVYVVQAFGSGGTTGSGGIGTYQLNANANQASATMYLGPWTYPGELGRQDNTVIVMDGGLDDSGDGSAAIISRLLAFDKAMTPLAPRWFYVQPGIDKGTTPANVTAWLALQAQIQAAIGWHYIPTYDYMRANGGGGTVGTAGGEVWALNNYGDTLHPSTTGQTNLSNCIMQYVEGLGN